ncbi:MAG: UDP-N-acetylmuramoyl-L-alanyl-D-glutamate--2,6-diaminopimelate ligase [Candidatus Kryptoniota bacterium]
MKLSDLLKNLTVISVLGDTGREISNLTYDSRRVEKDSLFVALKGYSTDGHRFIIDAIGSGASAVAVEDNDIVHDDYFLSHKTTKIVVPSTRRALAILSANFYGHPSDKLKIVGITGTNGKTTSSYLVKSILQDAGENVLLIGTINYLLNDKIIQTATHTTPESLELNQIMSSALKQGATSAVIEVSSHSLFLQRVYGMKFKAALFTNLTQDHLDFHGTMENYFNAKKILFDGLSNDAVAVVNLDDEYGKRIISNSPALKLTYGFSPEADLRIINANYTTEGTEINVTYGGKTYTVSSKLVGRFTSYNLCGAFGVGISFGIDPEKVALSLSKVDRVRGRFERVNSENGFMVVIDYAHTPDSLQKTLQSAREILKSTGKGGRLITVFGCGGNRDRTKRPRMGKIANELSDLVIVTSDNPRFEEPEAIVDEILAGIKDRKNVIKIVDRREAIKESLKLAGKNDLVVIAGKGHEDYQDIKGVKYHFDDREEVEKALGLRD